MFDIKPLDKQSADNSKPHNLPRHPFSMLNIGQKSSGKTTLISNLLSKPEFFKGKFNRIIFISPTASSDTKSKEYLMTIPNIISKNTALLKLSKRDRDKDKLTAPAPNSDPRKSGTTLTEDDFHEVIDEAFLADLITHQKSVIQKYGKALSDKILVILDDSISTRIMKSLAMSAFVFNSRHINCSIIFSSQHFKALQKSIRDNTSFLVLFEVNNRETLKDIYAEADGDLPDFKSWFEVYRQIVETRPYNFMAINFQNKPRSRLQDAFKTVFVIEPLSI
jgi:hypothetical protein